jgi:LPS-assembly protein
VVVKQADTLTYFAESQTLILEGHCILFSDQVYLRGDRMEYDQERGLVYAHGNVIAVSGLAAAFAEDLVADVNTGRMDVSAGKLLGKVGTTPAALIEATTPLEVARLGKTNFAASGVGFERVGPKEMTVQDLELTPCDCDPLRPHWSIRAHHSDLVVGDHAWLWLPVIYIYKVPALMLPVLYVPLEDRKSGLLIPKPHVSVRSGFGLEQPVFFTLGRSYDLTASPGFYLGNPSFVPPQNPAPGANYSQYFFGLKGPTLGLDFRYVPSTSMRGELTLGLVDDLQLQRIPIPQLDPDSPSFNQNPQVKSATPAIEAQRKALGKRGIRGSLNWHHEQDLADGFHDRIDASLLSDGYLLQDVTTDVLQRANEYIRSSARLFRATDNDYLGGDVTVRQDVRYGYSLFGNDPNWGIAALPTHGPNVLQRLPTFTYALPERPIGGPFLGGFEVQATRLGGLYGNRENDAPYNAIAAYNPVLLGIYPQAANPLRSVTAIFPPMFFLPPGNFPELGNGEARDRLDLRPTVSATFGDSALRLRPYASFREDLYVGEVTGDVAQRGYALGGVQLQSELSRVFASAQGPVRHAITPSLDFRYVPFVLGSQLNTYDEIDRAIPYDPLRPDKSYGLTQAVAQVSQSVTQRRGAQAVELARLTVGQELDLRRTGGLGDSFGQLKGSVGPVNADVAVRYDTTDARLTQTWASARCADKRGDFVEARYDGIILGGSDRQRAGLDALVGSPYPNATTVHQLPFANQLHAGAAAAVGGGLTLRYDALLQSPGASVRIPGIPVPPSSPTSFLNLSQQNFTLSFAPACNCWRVDLAAVFFPTVNLVGTRQVEKPFGSVDFHFNLTIANFGSFGA